MLGMKTLLAYAAIVLALVVTTGTSEDIEDPETEELQLADENEITDIEPDYEALLASLQRAREIGYDGDDVDDKRMASGWKRGQSAAAGWKRGQSAAAGWKRGHAAAPGWKRGHAAAPGWKRGHAAAPGWKRGQYAAAGWKRAQAAGWKRDYPIEVDTRAGENWRNSQMKAASGWKRTLH